MFNTNVINKCSKACSKDNTELRYEGNLRFNKFNCLVNLFSVSHSVIFKRSQRCKVFKSDEPLAMQFDLHVKTFNRHCEFNNSMYFRSLNLGI